MGGGSGSLRAVAASVMHDHDGAGVQRRQHPAGDHPRVRPQVVRRVDVPADIFELVSELAPLHPRANTFPGEVFLNLVGDALDWCGASRADPLSSEGLRDRFLPERIFRGRQNSKFRYAVLAAAALHGGTEPDLLEEVVWWQTDDFWQYASFAALAYIRAAASRAACRCARHARTWPGALVAGAITTSSGRSGSCHLRRAQPIR